MSKPRKSKLEIMQTKTPDAKRILGFHWKQAMQQKKPALFGISTAVVSIVIERYLAPLIIAHVLTNIQTGSISLGSSAWLIASYFFMMVIADIGGYRLTLYLMWTVQVRGAKNIYETAYARLTDHSLKFFNNTFAGSLVSQVNKTGKAFMDFWNLVVYKIVFFTTALIATLIGVGFISWQYSLVLFVLTAIYAAATFYGNRSIRPVFVARSRNYSKLSAQLADSIGNILTVKIEGKETEEKTRFKQTTTELLDSELRARSKFIKISTVYSSIVAVMKIAALVAAILLVQQQAISAGLVYLCLIYTFNLLEEIWNIHSVFRDYHGIIADSEEMLETMESQPEISDSSTKKLHTTVGRLSLENVSYAYSNSTSLFTNLSLHVPAKQKVGLVGVSGSGKTTLTKLIMRFMDIDSGSITIDDTNIADVTQRSLRQAVAYVPQEPLLFHRSLHENISYSNSSASEKAIMQAAKRAQAYEFINDLPDGFDTLVGERGVKLSGGQRQRVAIARAILKDAPIIILDEATSALDSESEQAVQAALDELWRDKTAIVVAHRLSTIAKLDRIIVLDKGNIAEDGTHAELLARNGIYAKLWNHQSGGFIEE